MRTSHDSVTPFSSMDITRPSQIDIDRSGTMPYCENAVQAGDMVTNMNVLPVMVSLKELLGLKEGDSACHVVGDSMIDAGFHPDDLLLLRSDIVPQDGDIVIAEINGESNVKEYHYDAQSKTVELRPYNSNYPSRFFTAEDPTFYISSVVLSVTHKLR